MATIDRDKLYSDTICWLPDNNALKEDQVRFINESVITSVGDDQSKYGEVLCKSLLACANANKAKQSVDTGNVTRERVGNVEIYYDSKEETWDKYIASLPQVCSLFGYELRRPVGISIGTGGVENPLKGCCKQPKQYNGFTLNTDEDS